LFNYRIHIARPIKLIRETAEATRLKPNCELGVFKKTEVDVYTGVTPASIVE
jgi:hypothetical protein